MFIGLSILPSISSTNIDTPQILGISKTVIQVDNEGDGDYTRIQDAIDNATVGDTIEVYSGTYIENVMIDKSLNLYGIDYELGSGGDEGMPIVMEKEQDTDYLLSITADGCNFSGFAIHENVYFWRGIYCYQSDYNNIFGNYIYEGSIGICTRESNNNNIYDNDFSGCNTAIVISDSDNNKIYQNHLISDNTQGILLKYHAEYNLVFKNIIEDIGGAGIYEWKANNNTIFENIITGCGASGIGLAMDDGVGYGYTVYDNQISNCERGINIHGKLHQIYRNNISNCKYGIDIDWIGAQVPSQQIDIYENNIKNNIDTGINLCGVYLSNIYRNNITGNRHGMWIDESEDNNIFENNIKYNERIGMHLWSSRENLIYHNNFIGNDVNAWCDGEQVSRWNDWNLGYTNDGGGNYWDDYKGKDNNNDGVGDTPYIIPDDDIFLPNNKDKYPLMEPDGRPNYRVRTLSLIGFIERYFERFPFLVRFISLLIN